LFKEKEGDSQFLAPGKSALSAKLNAQQERISKLPSSALLWTTTNEKVVQTYSMGRSNGKLGPEVDFQTRRSFTYVA
jgi:hypothetical protein